MPDRADESGFPRQIGRSLGQPAVAVLALRKRQRVAKANEGDLVIWPVDDKDVPQVSIDPRVVSLLEEVLAAVKENTDVLREQR